MSFGRAMLRLALLLVVALVGVKCASLLVDNPVLYTGVVIMAAAVYCAIDHLLDEVLP